MRASCVRHWLSFCRRRHRHHRANVRAGERAPLGKRQKFLSATDTKAEHSKITG